MKPIAVAVLAAASSVAAAQSQAAADSVREHSETTFKVLVHAPYNKAAALFTPEGERAWAGKQWNPQYLYPQNSGEEQGTVFTISHGPLTAVWIITQHDLAGRHFQYIYTLANLLITAIDVRFQSLDADTTEASIRYARTALSAEGDEHVRALTAADQAAGGDWQRAVDHYLSSEVR